MRKRSKSTPGRGKSQSSPNTPSSDSRRGLLSEARAVIEAEGRAVLALLDRLDGGFTAAVERILACRGRVVVTGMGKSGIVAQKISATLASTGTPSLFLHAAEAVHGDIGRITGGDVVVALSYSGESDEIVRLVRPVRALGAILIAMTGEPDSALARHADVVISIGHVTEACPMGLVPTASTTAMMVVGDALAICLFSQRGLSREDYAIFHPGGALGRKLMRVRELMRAGDENPVVKASDTLRRTLEVMTKTKGRPGATSIVDGRGKLVGFFTDGDLRRLLDSPGFSMDAAIRQVMHHHPKTVHPDQLVVEAARILSENKVDQLPVIDERGRPVGLIDVQDVLSTREA
jgi:arabinose-5-phosphate isomerase